MRGARARPAVACCARRAFRAPSPSCTPSDAGAKASKRRPRKRRPQKTRGLKRPVWCAPRFSRAKSLPAPADSRCNLPALWSSHCRSPSCRVLLCRVALLCLVQRRRRRLPIPWPCSRGYLLPPAFRRNSALLAAYFSTCLLFISCRWGPCPPRIPRVSFSFLFSPNQPRGGRAHPIGRHPCGLWHRET